MARIFASDTIARARSAENARVLDSVRSRPRLASSVSMGDYDSLRSGAFDQTLRMARGCDPRAGRTSSTAGPAHFATACGRRGNRFAFRAQTGGHGCGKPVPVPANFPCLDAMLAAVLARLRTEGSTASARHCRTPRATCFLARARGSLLEGKRVHRGHRAGAFERPWPRTPAFARRRAARALLARGGGAACCGDRGGAKSRAPAHPQQRARCRGDDAVAAGPRAGAQSTLRAPHADARRAEGTVRAAPRRHALPGPGVASGMGIARRPRRAAARGGRRRWILDGGGARAQSGAARASPLGRPRGRLRAALAYRSASAGDDAAPLPAQPAAHALVGNQRAPRPSAPRVPPLGAGSMVEPVPAAQPVCTLCGGEGFTFQQLEDRGVAVACSCTRNCASCHGQGRLYARDERGYEVLRGCGCGADPRRLSLLTGLRLPTKFLNRTLAGYAGISPDQKIALARAHRFVDEFVPCASGQRALLFCGPPGSGTTHLPAAVLRDLL